MWRLMPGFDTPSEDNDGDDSSSVEYFDGDAHEEEPAPDRAAAPVAEARVGGPELEAMSRRATGRGRVRGACLTWLDDS
jgi:hypothetical protein